MVENDRYPPSVHLSVVSVIIEINDRGKRQRVVVNAPCLEFPYGPGQEPSDSPMTWRYSASGIAPQGPFLDLKAVAQGIEDYPTPAQPLRNIFIWQHYGDPNAVSAFQCADTQSDRNRNGLKENTDA